MVDDLLVSFQLVHPFIMTYRPTIIQTDRNQSWTVVINYSRMQMPAICCISLFLVCQVPRPPWPSCLQFPIHTWYTNVRTAARVTL